jgi:hypothetical protein
MSSIYKVPNYGQGHKHFYSKPVTQKEPSLGTHNHAHNHSHVSGDLLKRFKEIFTLPRLAIIGAVVGSSNLLSNAANNFFGPNDSDGNQNAINGQHAHGNSLQSLALYFGQLVLASGLGLFLDGLLIAKLPFRGALAKVFSHGSAKLILGLAAFNTALEGLINKASQKANSTFIEALGALAKIVGTFTLARAIGGANSLTSLLAASCPCCGVVVCVPELITFFSSVFNLVKSVLIKPKAQINDINNRSSGPLNNAIGAA